MRPSKCTGLALLAVLALGAVAATAALAAAPEIGRCEKVAAKTGKFSSATCTTEKAGGSYEWVPGAVKNKFTGTGAIGTLETVGKVAVQCKTEASKGHFTGTKTVGGVEVEFNECLSGGFKCETPGTGVGIIKTKTLAGELGVGKQGEKKGRPEVVSRNG